MTSSKPPPPPLADIAAAPFKPFDDAVVTPFVSLLLARPKEALVELKAVNTDSNWLLLFSGSFVRLFV